MISRCGKEHTRPCLQKTTKLGDMRKLAEAPASKTVKCPVAWYRLVPHAITFTLSYFHRLKEACCVRVNTKYHPEFAESSHISIFYQFQLSRNNRFPFVTYFSFVLVLLFSINKGRYFLWQVCGQNESRRRRRRADWIGARRTGVSKKSDICTASCFLRYSSLIFEAVLGANTI